MALVVRHPIDQHLSNTAAEGTGTAFSSIARLRILFGRLFPRLGRGSCISLTTRTIVSGISGISRISRINRINGIHRSSGIHSSRK